MAERGTSPSSELRENVIVKSNLDIVGICETHLMSNEGISIDNYVWFGNNRKTISPRARKGSGGVGILVKESVLQHFSINVIDCELEGTLCVQFTSLESSDSFQCVCVCYLPPANSSRGNNASEFFEHLLGTIHALQEVENICVCGDFNARCGSKQELSS